MYLRFAAMVLCTTGLSGCASQSKSCCDARDSQCSTCCGEPVTARDEAPRVVRVLDDNLAPLREAFNAHADRWRVVSLVSPTCSECVYGAEAVRKEIVDRYPPTRVSAINVWIPMIPTDSENTARKSATILPADRGPQFYDGRQSAGWAYSRDTFAGFVRRARASLPEGHHLTEAFDNRQDADGPQWDLYMLYAPGVRWSDRPPMPTHWIRHCGRTDGANSTYWQNSPDAPPRDGNLFEAMRRMADDAIGGSVQVAPPRGA